MRGSRVAARGRGKALAPKMTPATIANQKAAGNLIIFLIGNQLISGSYQLESEGPLDETY